MDKEIIDKLKNKLDGQSLILDIGFGTGQILFELLHEIIPIKIIGIESQSKENIESCYATFLGRESDKGIYELIKGDKIDLFDYYKYYISKLDKLAFDKNSFNEKVDLIFNTSLVEFMRTNQLKYDLIVLFNVLHYSEIGNPIGVLKKIRNLLTQKGMILIGFKKYIHSSDNLDRQEVNIDEVLSYLKSDFNSLKLTKTELDDSRIYLGELKASI